MKTNTHLTYSFVNDLPLEHLEKLHEIINSTYLTSERVFWKEDAYERISLEALKNELNQGNICVAFGNMEPVGCVKVGATDNDEAEFGMLCVDFDYRGRGIALELVRRAENRAMEQDFNQIQLQLLLPSEFKHDDKEQLKVWYAKMGYEMIEQVAFEDYYPHLMPLMKIPCTFEIWSKPL